MNDSLTPEQNQNIDNILKNLLDYIKKEKIKINSLILFVYQNEDHELIRDIEKLKSKSRKKINIEEKINDIKVYEYNKKFNNIINNTKLFYSNVCGCGKSSLIKKKAKEKNYIYFPLGGFLTKKLIFKKLSKIIAKIEDPKNTVIHLDLYDTEQDYLMRDFLFSFLITKFYSYFENILSIPLDTQLFIEIPNEFYNYLDRYKILKFFISEKEPEIKLDSIKANFKLSKEYNINSFLNFAKTGQKSEEDLEANKIKDLLYEYIGIKNPSFYQIEIFCKCISFINKKDINFILDSKKVFEWTKLFTENIYSHFIIKNGFINKEKENNINTLMEKLTEINNEINQNKEKMQSYPLIFLKNPMIYEFNFKKDEEPNILLKYLKNIMSLDNPVENDNNNLKSLKNILGNYVINNDNFIKMALILYRIKAKIPVIIMGETGCGKTSLIKKLNQFQNNGNSSSLEIFNIHSGITEQDIIKKMNEINQIAQEKNEIWLFFDEINTFKSLGLFSEIFSKHSFDGIELKKNVILLGACNPYRISSKIKPECGLKYNQEIKYKKDLVYLVNPLPFSLMNFVYYFKNIAQNYEKEYIKSILQENCLLKKNGNMIIELITFSHDFIKKNGDISSVSLREINRFSILFKFFFENYYTKKNDYIKEAKKDIEIIDDEIKSINSIILGIYVCYYVRLFNSKLREDFRVKANKIITEQIINANKIITEQKINNKIDFIDVPNEEKNFIINEIELEPGIGKNNILKENIFLMFIAINTKIPLIICGKPGCSKSLSFQLIFKSMLGEYSNSIFFRYFPSIIRSCFQGSITTSSNAVSKLFEIAKEKLENWIEAKKKNENKNQLPISLVYFDELGLAEKSKENPLKVLHSQFDLDLNENEEKKIGFVGISNWSLDSAKMNRAISLFVEELDNKLDDIRDTMISIVENINSDIYGNYKKEFTILYESYYYFKKFLRDNNSEYFDKLGSRDFYHLIRYCAGKINSLYIKNKNKILSEKALIVFIKKAIERNFSGFEFDDIERKKFGIENSVILFKQKYNELCEEKGLINKKINNINNKYEIIERIRENLSEYNCRYLMLKTKLSMQSFILDNLLSKIENKVVIEKSPFRGDNSSDYLIDIINRIKNSISKGDTLILIDLKELFDSLFDLFNQNWTIKDGKKYARICLGYYTDSLTFVHDKFKCIIILDNTKEKQLKQQEPLESRFEKHILTYHNILNEDLLKKGKSIYSKIESILKIDLDDNEKKINYKVEELLVNFDYEEILNLIYDLSNKNHNLNEDSLFENICKIFAKILPQDIIASFNFSKEARKSNLTSTIEESYFENEIINIIDFIKNNKSKFSIIYTLSTINEQINKDEENNILVIKINHINTTQEFLKILDDFYENNKLSILLIKFEGKKSYKIQTIIFIIKNYEKLKNNYINGKKFIFTCHIKRNFEISNNKKYDISTVSLVSDVNQRFIDDLNGLFKLKDILNANIIEILNNLELEEITSRYFKNFLLKNEEKKLFEIKDNIKGINKENFIIKIFNWIKEEKEYVVSKINNVILDKIENKEKTIKEYMIKDIFENGKIKENDIDLISIIKKISIEIFENNLDNFFKITENNNFLTNIFINSFDPELLVGNVQDKISEISDDLYKFKNNKNLIEANPKLIKRKKGNNNINNKNNNNLALYLNKNSIIKNIIELFFSSIDLSDNIKIDSLNINITFKLPGFFNILKEMNKYINQNIALNFYLNEKKLRYSLAKNKELNDLIIKFHENERQFFELTYNKFIAFPLIQSLLEIQFKDKSELDEFRDLLIKDYLNLYLRKYYISKKDYNDEFEYDIILLLLNLRYNKNNKLITSILNENSSELEKIFKVFIINIIWIESYKDSSLDYLIIYNKLSLIFEDKKSLLKKIKEIINEKKIKYVVQEGRNPEHTKEVNEPFYLILSSICVGISSSEKIGNNNVDEEYFNFESIENAIKIIKRINSNLLLFSNEIYILSEFIEIKKVFKINGVREKEAQIEILKLLNENSTIINNNEFNSNIIDDLKENITKLYKLIDEKIKKKWEKLL